MQRGTFAVIALGAVLLLESDRMIVRTQGSGTWTFVAPTSQPHTGHGAAVAPDGRIVVVDDEGVEAYDVVANTWTTLAPLTIPRFNLGAATGTDGRIYAVGGNDAMDVLSVVEAYHAIDNTWTFVADMPTARASAAIVAGLDGRIYAIGGRDATVQALGVVEAYDPSTNSWSTLASMPTPRFEHSASRGLDGRIYAIGGRSLDSEFDTVEAYDPATNTWTTVSPLPTAVRALATATAPNGLVLAIGGIRAGQTEADDTVYGLSPSSNTWTHLPSMSVARLGHAAVPGPDGRIYAIGGVAGQDSGPSTAVEALAFPPHTLRLYLHGTDAPPTAGGFTMSPTPPSATPTPIALFDTTRWFSDAPLIGTFAGDAVVRFVKPCSLGLTLAATYTLAATDANGGSARLLGQVSRPFSLCLASETIAIPMVTPARLSNERLAFAIATLAGTNVTLAPGAGMYLEATSFTGAR